MIYARDQSTWGQSRQHLSANARPEFNFQYFVGRLNFEQTNDPAREIPIAIGHHDATQSAERALRPAAHTHEKAV
jgi:hypothetical protein